jgi:hypothetical protein
MFQGDKRIGQLYEPARQSSAITDNYDGNDCSQMLCKLVLSMGQIFML